MTSVLYGSSGRVATITLNRPDCLNAINADLAQAFARALLRAETDPEIDVILLNASGRAFCAGDDLVELASGELDDQRLADQVEDLQSATRTIMLGRKPVVCAAQGWIVGGAVAWLLNADFVVVSEDAVLFCPEAKHGLFPTGGVSILLAEQCGQSMANQVLWLGERLDAKQMLGHRIATRVAPRDGLDAAALALVQQLLDLPAVSRTRLKRARAEPLADRLEMAMAFETACCLKAVSDVEMRARVGAGDWR